MPQLDGVRAVAIIGVLIEHFSRTVYDYVPTGFLGVRLFFVLSGFLITGLLLTTKAQVERGTEKRPTSFRLFYVRRFLRLGPPFYVALAWAVALSVPFARETFAWHAAYLTNVYTALSSQNIWPLNPYWSLAVEEQFYLVWPMIILLADRRSLERLVIGVIVVGPVFRALISLWAGDPAWADVVMPGNANNLTGLPFASLDCLGLGALLALYSDRQSGNPARRERLVGTGGIGLPLTVGAILLRNYGIAPVLVSTILPLATGMVAVSLVGRAAAGVSGPAGALLGNRLMMFWGQISYAIYLWHGLFFGWTISLMRRVSPSTMTEGVVLVGALLVVTLAIARRASSQFQLTAGTGLIFAALFVIVVAGRKVAIISDESATGAVLFILRSWTSFTAAILSWEILERPLSRWRKSLATSMTGPSIAEAAAIS